MNRFCTAAAGVLAIALTGLASTYGASAAPPSSPQVGSEAPRPMLAYAGVKNVVIVAKDGTVLSRVRRGTGGFSLDGRVLAKGYATDNGGRTVGYDTDTGDPLYAIPGTLLIPTALRDGRAVAFLGRGKRDPYATSLWLRNNAGRERQLLQFAFGTGTPGIKTGISEGYVMEYSFDQAAQVAAVVAGNDYVDFKYDVWVLDVDTRTTRRLTKGQHSRYPAVAPSGHRIAYFSEEEVCGGPMPHYRGGDLLVVDPDGTDRHALYDGDCDRYLDRPRWIDDETVVVVSHTRRADQDPGPLYDSELVLVDVPTGVVSDPISVHGRVGEVSVSPALSRVAYTDWTDPDGFAVFRWNPGDTAPADMGAWIQGKTTSFDVGWAPHLRGDPTLVVAY